ncbi:protein bfr2-like [Lolium rigidum]|uniref:protein bfr2-like n=1 Tax=Lolium rigidum TaxID=89674 RepID=UPI001F5CB886|nr:protein bfr2-like [Lolium rigidum]
MEIAEMAKKVAALEAELAAKSSRIADLEARVSLLETEKARFRKVLFSDRVEDWTDDEVEIMDAEGGAHSVSNADLEDDDVSITPRGKNRAGARVISDSEDDDENDGGHGNQEVGVASTRKRALRGVSDSESEEEDCELLYEMKRCSTPPTTGRSARFVKSQSKRSRTARRVLELLEPKDHEQSEDDSEEDDSMDEFIDDSDCSENSSDSDEESSAELEESDNEENYGEIMDRIRGKKNAKNKDWETEAEMLSAFDEHRELTLKAVCALYRQQTEEEQAEKATIVHNKRGFSQIDAPRGSRIAQFLLDGDASGPLKKTAQDLKKYDRYGLQFCHKMAFRYSKQLFAIYQSKEDPYFP